MGGRVQSGLGARSTTYPLSLAASTLALSWTTPTAPRTRPACWRARAPCSRRASVAPSISPWPRPSPPPAPLCAWPPPCCPMPACGGCGMRAGTWWTGCWRWSRPRAPRQLPAPGRASTRPPPGTRAWTRVPSFSSCWTPNTGTARPFRTMTSRSKHLRLRWRATKRRRPPSPSHSTIWPATPTRQRSGMGVVGGDEEGWWWGV